MGTLSSFRDLVTDMLLDKLAAVAFRDPGFRAERCRHSFEDVKAVAQVLRVLTKESWDSADLTLFDRFWPDTTRSDLFGKEFESERYRIGHHVADARKALLADEPSRSTREFLF